MGGRDGEQVLGSRDTVEGTATGSVWGSATGNEQRDSGHTETRQSELGSWKKDLKQVTEVTA